MISEVSYCRDPNEKRIGVIYIASSLSLEREWPLVLPKEVSFHVTRITLEDADATNEKLIEMLESGQVERAARQLASAEVDVIAFACTAGSFIKGAFWDRELANRITAAADGIPTTTTSGALLEALSTLKCKKINLATPYLDEINLLEKAFLENNGFEVKGLVGEQCLKDQDIYRVTPERFIEMHTEMFEEHPDVDACFISCTNSRTMEAIRVLEDELGIPVLSSNQVTLWSALKKAGFKGSIKGYGSLLERYL